MNNDTPFTTEFIDNDKKRRQQIPIAVFTIVAAHVVLFLGLLGAAGCKKEAKADTDKDNAAQKFASAEYKGQPAAPAATASQAAAEETPQYGPLDEQNNVTEPEDFVEAPVKASATAAVEKRSLEKTLPQKALAKTAPAGTGDPATYTVKSGDSLIKIAKQYGTTPQAIKTANGLKKDMIRVGQKLKIAAGMKSRDA
jgi:LysM repeat protein